jgi:hypothetical protein
MERITPYAAPVNRSGRVFGLALAAVGLAGAGIGIGAYASSRSPVAAPSPAVITVEAAPQPIAAPKPAAPVDPPPQRSAEIDRLLQAINESEVQRREDSRKATERVAELERQAATARQEEIARRADDERRATEEAQRRRAAEQRAQDEAQRAEDERRRADERARQQAAWDAVRQMQADQQAEVQRRAAETLEEERRRIEAVRRRLAERAAAVPQVTGVNLWATTPTVHGPYPRTIQFTGWVTVDGPTTIRFRFVGSDGTVSPVRTLACPRPGRYSVATPWRISGVGSGSVTLEVLDPSPVSSTASYTAAP